MKTDLNILFASNEVFSPYLGVSMYSLLECNFDDFDKINIFIFDDDISEKSKNKLEDIANSFNQELIFIPISQIQLTIDDKIHSMEKEGIRSLTAYARLFASSALPELDKIIYLDADSLIQGSFRELWNLDIGDYYIGGVEDILNIDVIRKDIELAESNRYINSGFLLINLKKWREINIESKFANFLKKHSDRFIFHDQGIINGVCKDNILYLDPKYNLLSMFHGISYKKARKLSGIPNYYTEKTVNEARLNPIFIHFSGGVLNRPWSNKNQPYNKLYYEYVNKTPFKNEIKNEDISAKDNLFYRFYQSKLLSALLFFVPMSLSVKFANIRVKNLCRSEFESFLNHMKK